MRSLSSLAVAAILAASLPAVAAPAFSLHTTGTNSAPAGTVLDHSSYIVNADTLSSNGSFPDLTPGTFDVTQTSGTSDPDIFPTPQTIHDLHTFSYFGLVSTYDQDHNPTDARLFVALLPGTLSTVPDFNAIFAPFLADHPEVTSLADLINVVRIGPDDPNQLAIRDTWIAFDDYVGFFDDNNPLRHQFRGAILTPFQPGQSLDLVTFDPSTGTASTFGSIATEAIPLPEPSTALCAATLLPLLKRRRA